MRHVFSFCFTSILTLFLFQAQAQPWQIGNRSITYTDPARNNRSIPLTAYYPAQSQGSNVPVAAGSFPVVIIGHGFVMDVGVYSYIWNNIVPKGYIVLAVATETGFSPSHENFGKDFAFLATKLQNENLNVSSPFYQKVADKTAIVGHSMGGGSAILGTALATDVTTVVTLAAAETNPSAVAASANITVPSLFIIGQDDCVTPWAGHQQGMWNNIASANKALVNIKNGSHCYFGNYSFNCAFGEGTCLPVPNISRATQQTITLRYLNPWLDFFLKNNCAAWTSFSDSAFSDNSIIYSLAGNMELPEPTGLHVTRINPVSARLNWQPVELAQGYVIRGRALNTPNWITVNVSNPAQSFLDVSSLYANVGYEWQIQARCQPGGSLVSQWSVLDTFYTGCFYSDSLWVTNITTTSAVLNWSRVYGIDGYEIRGRIAGSTGGTNLLVAGSANTQKQIFGLQPGATYEWRIRTVCSQAVPLVSPWSPWSSFSTNNSSNKLPFDWEDITAGSSEIVVYPNPAVNGFYIYIPSSAGAPVTVEIRSPSGQVFYQQNAKEGETHFIPRNSLLSGGYIVVARNATFGSVRRIIFQ